MTHYARVLAGTAIDDASLDVFVAAMKPLADHRESLNQRIAAARAANKGQLDAVDELEKELDLDAPLPELGETETETETETE